MAPPYVKIFISCSSSYVLAFGHIQLAVKLCLFLICNAALFCIDTANWDTCHEIHQ